MPKWIITADKFLTTEQITDLISHLLVQRDLAIARSNNHQAIRDYYAIKALLETGLRVFEFCALRNEDLSGHKLNVRHGKGDKPRTVLLTKGTAITLKEWQAVKVRLGYSGDTSSPFFPNRHGKHYSTRGVQKRVKAVLAALGLPAHLSVHSFRHTYCSLLLASGKVSVATVRDNLGHHSISVTNLYAHAMADLSDIDLYPPSSSYNSEKSEPQPGGRRKKTNDVVNTFLRSMNQKSNQEN
jgi:site-specific recombinase XerD